MESGVGGMASLIHQQTFTITQENYTITASVMLMNKDLDVNLTGGQLPHLGGVVSYDHQTGKIQKIYFASHDGRKHKDILLAERFVKRIAHQLPGSLCVTAGVHIDGITAAQINASFPMTDELAKQVAHWVNHYADDFSEPRYSTHLKNFKPKEGTL